MEKLTKVEIQAEYSKIVPQLGEITYRALAPVVSYCQMLSRVFFLNQEMSRRLAEEAEAQKAAEPKKAETPPAAV